MDKVRTGIAGMGNMGTSHARNILAGKIAGLVLTAVSDQDASRMSQFPDLKQFPDAREMIKSGEIDAVLIATPHYDHTDVGIAALEQGLHVLVEKPISVHKADCERLIAAHKNEKQVFAAMFNQRTDPRYQKLRQLVKEGELGEIRRVIWIITNWFRTEHYYASGGWRATWAGEGGGVLLNQCPHNLDLWQWMFGMPRKIRAFCDTGRYHDIEVEDDVTAYMEYADGMKGVFITTTGEAPGTNRLEVTGERGKVVLEDGLHFTRNEVPMTEFSKTSKQSFARPPVWEIGIPVHGEAEQHVGIMRNFAGAILKGEKLLASAAEGIHSVELGNAMLYSSFTDAAADLPLDSAAFEQLLKKKIEESTFVKKTAEGKTSAEDFAKSFNG